MRVAVIGLGSAGKRHSKILIAQGCQVLGYDNGPRAVWLEETQEWAQSWADVVDWQPDALVIATPIETHLAYVEWAVANKVPFFVEKSIGTIEQLPRWRELAAMDLPVNQVGYNLRFHPDVKWLLMGVPNPTSGMLLVSWDGAKYAHPLLESSHEIDLLRVCFGDRPLTEVTRDGADLEACFGDLLSVAIDSSSPDYWRMWRLESGARFAAMSFAAPEELGTEMYEKQMVHFLASVATGTPTSVPLSEGLATLELCAQIEAMA